MNMQPVHYAPHHNDHLPLCGAEPDRATNGGVVICTMTRDNITCFRCIDQYEERAATPAQIEAMAEARRAIDEAMAGIEELLAFDAARNAALHAMHHMLTEHTRWWQFLTRFRIARAMTEIRALKLEDFKGDRRTDT